MTGNSFTVDNETSCDTVACVRVPRNHFLWLLIGFSLGDPEPTCNKYASLAM